MCQRVEKSCTFTKLLVHDSLCFLFFARNDNFGSGGAKNGGGWVPRQSRLHFLAHRNMIDQTDADCENYLEERGRDFFL